MKNKIVTIFTFLVTVTSVSHAFVVGEKPPITPFLDNPKAFLWNTTVIPTDAITRIGSSTTVDPQSIEGQAYLIQEANNVLNGGRSSIFYSDEKGLAEQKAFNFLQSINNQ